MTLDVHAAVNFSQGEKIVWHIELCVAKIGQLSSSFREEVSRKQTMNVVRIRCVEMASNKCQVLSH
jgi:hypothetical protein